MSDSSQSPPDGKALHALWGKFVHNEYLLPLAILVVGALVSYGALRSGLLGKDILDGLTTFVAATFAVLVALFKTYQSFKDQQKRTDREDLVEVQFRNNPEKPQLAWDLARIKLENYLDRNLSQVRSIYWLTLLAMFAGFGFVMYGLWQASLSPDKLPVSIVASASGVLISFIGGSFLLIYRSILSQSKDYVTVLERINAVGMAVQVIGSIPDADAKLKNASTAELARQLLGLYGSMNAGERTRRPRSSTARAAE